MLKFVFEKKYDKNCREMRRYKLKSVEGVPTLEELKEIAPLEYFTEGNFLYRRDGLVVISEPLETSSIHHIPSNIPYNLDRFFMIISDSYDEEELSEFLEQASACDMRLRECIERAECEREEWEQDEEVVFILQNGEVTKIK